ncbi:DUF1345 domain-containing protein [Spirosoma fluminis]
MLSGLLRQIAHLDSHHRLFIALTVTTVVLTLVPATFSVPARLTIAWVSYAMTLLSLMWTTISVAHPRDIPRLSRLQDSSRTLILLFVVAAAIASLFAVVALLDGVGNNDRLERITLALLAVANSWALVHSVFTLHYAHVFYGNTTEPDKPPGGLDFPHEPEPDYLDFAYFSFVIGMTSQVSDVTICSKSMRRIALAHGVLSFGFNTLVIALTVSGLSGAL